MRNLRKLKTLLKTIFQISPSYIFLIIIGSLLESAQIIGNVILPKYLIEELIGAQDPKRLILFGGGIVIFNLVMGFINRTYKRLLEVSNQAVNLKLTEAMGKKIMAVEYHYLEDPYYLDLKERAVFACNNQGALERIIHDLASIISQIFTMISLVVIMFSLSYLLVIILLTGSIITVLISNYFKKYQNKFYQGLIPLNRRYGYYLMLNLEDNLQKDLRVYHLNPMITNSVIKFNQEINNELTVFARKQGTLSGLQKVINVIQSGFVYLFVALRVFTDKFGKKISLGDFTMYVSSAISFTRTFDTFFFSVFEFMLMLDYLDPFLEFMELKDAKVGHGKEILEEIKNITFENVTFKYQKSDKIILDNVSFTINKGEKISIVGLNGAGKTTLIKLLCRLYQPDQGKIMINGIDIWDYDYQSYIDKLSAVFQDFKLLAYSIKDNIIGNKSYDHNKLESIINQVGLHQKISELPHGIDTVLNKAYDEEGIELSGGQGQKVAIARALYKDSQIVILDEPTSALDPLAEAEIYEHFNELVLDKTAIYISHRMSSSVFCDRVLIIDNGKVSDFDTHAHLMQKKNSLYYKLFTSQAENYQI